LSSQYRAEMGVGVFCRPRLPKTAPSLPDGNIPPTASDSHESTKAKFRSTRRNIQGKIRFWRFFSCQAKAKCYRRAKTTGMECAGQPCLPSSMVPLFHVFPGAHPREPVRPKGFSERRPALPGKFPMLPSTPPRLAIRCWGTSPSLVYGRNPLGRREFVSVPLLSEILCHRHVLRPLILDRHRGYDPLCMPVLFIF